MPHSYLVCATPRSGSTLLCELLKTTGVAGWPEEYFEARRHSGVPRAPLEYFEEVDAPDVTDLLGPQPGVRAPDYSSLLGVPGCKEHLQRTRRLGTTPNGVFGAKLMWGHLQDFTSLARGLPRYRGLPLAGLLHKLIPMPDYVWVTRRDKLRQAVSLWRAIQTSAWRHGDDGHDSGDLRYDAAALDHLVRQLVAHDAAWGRYFADASIDPLVIVYEDDLLVDPWACVDRVLHRLGVEPAEHASRRLPTRRQADALNEAWVGQFLAERAPAFSLEPS